MDAAESLSGLCIDTGQLLRCDDASTDPRVNAEVCLRVGAVSMICVPLQHPDGGTVGVLKLYSSRAGGIRRGRRGDARPPQRRDRGAPDQRHAVRGRARRQPPRRAHRARQQARLRRGADPRSRPRRPLRLAALTRAVRRGRAPGRERPPRPSARRCGARRGRPDPRRRAKRRPGIPGRRRRVRARARRDRLEPGSSSWAGGWSRRWPRACRSPGQATLSMGIAEARSLDPRALHAEADAALHRSKQARAEAQARRSERRWGGNVTGP